MFEDDHLEYSYEDRVAGFGYDELYDDEWDEDEDDD